jgi:hypothetical protein
VIIILHSAENRLRAARSSVRFTAGAIDSSFLQNDKPGLGPSQPPAQWLPAVLYPGVNRSGCEVVKSSPFSTEVTNK